MRFKLDENMPADLFAELTKDGHDVMTCHQEGIAGAVDPIVAMHAKSEDRVLATFDLDFADIRNYPPGTHPGIVVLRLLHQDVRNCVLAFSRLLISVTAADFAGNLIIVEDQRVRIRRPIP